MKLGEISERIGGELIGDPALEIDTIDGLADAGPGAISFLANPKYTPLLAETKAAAVIVSPDIDDAPCALIRVKNPDLAFAMVAGFMVPPAPRPAVGVHPSAVVSSDAKIGDEVCIGACAVIEDGAKIGDRCVIYPNAYIGADSVLGEDCIVYPGAVIYHRVSIGARVILHASSVIGSDGFGYAWDGTKHAKIPQVGTVEIHDDVEIGACTVVDRARFGKTVIDAGTKLDNLIQIAHNVRIGAHSAFAAHVGVSGSTSIGSYVMVGGQCGFSGHITVGDGAKFMAQSGVNKSVPPGAFFSGTPAKPHESKLNEWRAIKALPRLRKTVKDLEGRIAALETESEKQ